MDASLRERFETAFRAGTGLSYDRELLAGLIPSVDGFLDAVTRAGDSIDGEALGLLIVIGSRAGDAGLSPRGLLALGSAVSSVEPSGISASELSALLAEGYVRGRDEAFQRKELARRIARHPLIELAPGVLAWVVPADAEEEEARGVAERFGRLLLERDAKCAVIDLTALRNVETSVLAEVIACDETARMLGARCIFACEERNWRDARPSDGMNAPLERAATFQDALAIAMRGARTSVPPPRGPMGFLRGAVEKIFSRPR